MWRTEVQSLMNVVQLYNYIDIRYEEYVLVFKKNPILVSGIYLVSVNCYKEREQ